MSENGSRAHWSKPKVILEVLAEGGSIELLARTRGDAREFAVRINDQLMAMFGEEPTPAALRTKVCWTTDWARAIERLNTQPWEAMAVGTMVPEFAAAIRQAYEARVANSSFQRPIERYRDRWIRAFEGEHPYR